MGYYENLLEKVENAMNALGELAEGIDFIDDENTQPLEAAVKSLRKMRITALEEITKAAEMKTYEFKITVRARNSEVAEALAGGRNFDGNDEEEEEYYALHTTVEGEPYEYVSCELMKEDL